MGFERIQQMTMLRYSDLSDEQREIITNGCGGKGGWFRPPQYLFRASCDQHDFQYWRGCTEADRKQADQSFLRWMLKDASVERSWWRRQFLRGAAHRYYLAVRVFGGKFFHFSDRMQGRKELDELTKGHALTQGSD